MPSSWSRPHSRRAFLQNGSLFLLAAGATDLLAAPDRAPQVRAGLITDLHYADKPTAGTRHYRDTLGKLTEAAGQFAREKPNFLVELGDFIDAAASVEVEQGYLAKVHQVFAQAPGPKHYVLGNHCVDMLTKEEFLQGVGQQKTYYSFDQGAFHFVVLDACFRSDGKPYGRKNSQWTDANLPAEELAWLKDDLRSSGKPTVVFAHQRLDDAGQHAVRNAVAARKILEAAGNVQAVFQGHSHKNDHQEIGGIHYCTLVAMVEGAGPTSSGYSLLKLFADGSIEVTGYRNQAKYRWR